MCVTCGGRTAPSWRFCEHCGAALDAEHVRAHKRGLAGFVRRQDVSVVVRYAVAVLLLLPIWLSSEIRQTASWHLVTRTSLITLVWLFSFIVVAVASGPAPATPPKALDDQTISPVPTEAPTAAPTSAPDPTPTPNDAAPLPASPETSSATQTTAIALDRLAHLRVDAEGPRAGYDRELFRHWLDADGDGCDTRREVLIQESLTPVNDCGLAGGRWQSAYDGVATTDPSSFDVDHFVPLAEAWDSGAASWSSGRRDSFANDLGYAGSLIAVTASTNRSKSDRDPGEWKPPVESYWCTYAVSWVEVKLRWDLTADTSEVSTLRSMLGACASAPVATAAPAPPVPVSQPTVAPISTQQPSSGNCHASYPDACIPPAPPDLDCGDISHRRFTVRHDVADPDPHGFDGADNDGIGCES